MGIWMRGSYFEEGLFGEEVVVWVEGLKLMRYVLGSFR